MMNHITNQVARAYPIPKFNMDNFDLKFARLLNRLQKLHIQQQHNKKATMRVDGSVDPTFYDSTVDKIAEIENILKTMEDLIDGYH
jgi:hypothetical protein